MTYRILIITFITSVLLFSCSKKDPEEDVICTDPGALNYNKPVACTYLKDRLIKKGGFSVTMVSYPLDPVQEGENFSMDVRPAGTANNHYSIKLLWKTGAMSPAEFDVTLAKDSFVIDPAVRYVSWALAPISGTGRFRNDSFFFNGIVHSSGGGDQPMFMAGN